MDDHLVNFCLGLELKIDFRFVMAVNGNQVPLPQSAQKASGSLGTDLAKQLAEPSFADWTLVCEGKEIPCHRFMLGSRSPVFKVMFEQDGFLESKTHQTQIKVH